MIETRDYNGEGRWSHAAIKRRWESYSKSFGTELGNIEPVTYETDSIRWIYPLVEAVIKGIEVKDQACIEIGIELIEDSDSMPFGMTVKSNAARALRHSVELLTEDQRRRIRARVRDMLISGYMPREFVQYVKLARKIGFDEEIPRVRSEANLKNRWVNHYLEMLEQVT